MIPTTKALHAVRGAREAQDVMKLEGRFEFTCADDELSDDERLTILVEEDGEVARAIHQRLPGELRAELIQVAAVALAWIENTDLRRRAAAKAAREAL